MKIVTGIIGAGRIGKLHAENIIFNFLDVKVKAIADPYIDKEWAKGLGIEVIDTSNKAIMDDKEIKTVLICSPSPTHAPLMVEAAAKGKHIFCEKPIDLDPGIIKQALSEVKKSGVKLQVGFNRRFDPNFAKVRQIVSEGKIGEPHIVRITSRDPAPPNPQYIKSSGGIFLDMTIHDFDMACFLSGSEVEELYATGSVLVDPEIGKQGDIDTAVITLKFKNGALGIIENSRKAVYGYDQRVEVFGSKGSIAANNNVPTNTIWSTSEGIIEEKPLFFFLERYKDSYIAEMKEFFSCIKSNKNPSVGGEAGLMSVVIGLAAKQSLQDKRPVKIKDILDRVK